MLRRQCQKRLQDRERQLQLKNRDLQKIRGGSLQVLVGRGWNLEASGCKYTTADPIQGLAGPCRARVILID